MNTIRYLVLFVVLWGSVVGAQSWEIAVLGGYQFGGIADETTQQEGIFTSGEALGIDGSALVGVVANYRLKEKMLLELSFDRQATQLNHHIPAEEHTEISRISAVNVDYYQLGLLYDWSPSRWRPFLGATVGIVSMNPSNTGYHSETHLAFTTMLGLRYFLNQTFAIRVQGKLNISRIPRGELFFPGYQHHKETFMSQIQLGVGVVVALGK